MPKSRLETVNRAARKKLAGSFVAVVVLENGRQIRAKLHQLSVSGGVLNPAKPLDEGIRQTRSLFKKLYTENRLDLSDLDP